MNKKAILALAISVALAGCVDGNKTEETTQTVLVSQSQNEQLENIVEEYFDEALSLSPGSATFVGQYHYNDQYPLPINADNRAKQQALIEKYLTRISALDVNQLTGQSLLTFEIFQRDLRLAQEKQRFPDYLIPIDQMNGEHNTFAGVGSGQSAQPFNTHEDYANFNLLLKAKNSYR